MQRKTSTFKLNLPGWGYRLHIFQINCWYFTLWFHWITNNDQLITIKWKMYCGLPLCTFSGHSDVLMSSQQTEQIITSSTNIPVLHQPASHHQIWRFLSALPLTCNYQVCLKRLFSCGGRPSGEKINKNTAWWSLRGVWVCTGNKDTVALTLILAIATISQEEMQQKKRKGTKSEMTEWTKSWLLTVGKLIVPWLVGLMIRASFIPWFSPGDEGPNI